MAKGSKNTAAAASTESTPANGGLIFQKMPDDFAIPTISRGGAWDGVVEQLCSKENKGSTVKVYETEKENVQLTYTRAKALKNAAKRLQKEIKVAVRILDGKSVLLAQGA